MKNKEKRFVTWMLAALLILANAPRIYSQQDGTQPQAQAVSQTGLLPVYGIDFRFDATWVDGSQFPSQSAAHPNFGVNAQFQQVWQTLQTSGFNIIRFPVDLRDTTTAANRVANLCVWAKNNNVKVVPILAGAERGQQLGADFTTNTSAFVKALLAALRSGGGQHLDAYTRILLYQFEDQMNHAGLHRAMPQQTAQERLLKAADALRQSELEALKDTGLNATPLMVNASFDYELIRAGAIAGTTLSDNSYSQAYERMKLFLAALAASPNIDVIDVNWFAGTLSAGGIERFPTILRSLSADLPGKQIVMTTGFSTGFRAAEEQKNFYTQAFANLADYRASAGVDTPFIGVFFHEALNGSEPSPVPPSPKLATKMTGWNWTAKAEELARVWSSQGSSDAMTWWLKKVENNMGLVGIQTDSTGNATVAAQPAQAGLEQIANAVSEASATVPVDTTATSTDPSVTTTPDSSTSTGSDPNNPTSTTSGDSSSSSGGFGSGLKDKLQQGLMGLLDRVFELIGNKISGIGSGAGSGAGAGGVDTGNTPPTTGGTGGVDTGNSTPTTDGTSGGATGTKSPATLISTANFAARPKTAVRSVLPPVFTVGKLSVPSTFNKGAATVRPIVTAGTIGTSKTSIGTSGTGGTGIKGITGTKPASISTTASPVRPIVGVGVINTANTPTLTTGNKTTSNTGTTVVGNTPGNSVVKPGINPGMTIVGKPTVKTPAPAPAPAKPVIPTFPVSKPPTKTIGVKPVNITTTGNSTGSNASNSSTTKPADKTSSTGKSAGNKEPSKQSGKIFFARPTPSPKSTPPTAPSPAISLPAKRQ
ncbi:MAG: hypothetical protein MOB07_30695 [Acidobacteria bacterium]|nr:hypothetical protein [Acidobacteriota bacterium]